MVSDKVTPDEEATEESEPATGEATTEVSEPVAGEKPEEEAGPAAEEKSEEAEPAAEETPAEESEEPSGEATAEVSEPLPAAVTTVEDKELHDYEMVVVISPEVEGEQLDATLDNIGRFITGRGGVIAEIERWGKRKLAYPVKHFTEGQYVLNHFKMKPGVGKELEASLLISEDILRHLLIRLDT
ncbi:30S ribosomal protein S6 [Chloroflexota bacterium]